MKSGLVNHPLRVMVVLCIGLWLSWLPCSSGLLGQSLCTTNMIPNPSFELFSACPTGWGQLGNATPWTNVWTGGSPDLFNFCTSATQVSVPGNVMGWQMPRDGMGYAGFYNSATTKEYLQSPLTSPLLAGQRYDFSMWVVLGNNIGMATDDMGAYFSPTQVTTGTVPLSVVPQVLNPAGNVLADTMNWMLVTGQFVASGGEEYVIIGGFGVNNTYAPIQATGYPTYYKIDDVCLREHVFAASADTAICAGASAVLTVAGFGPWNWADSLSPSTVISTNDSVAVQPQTTTTFMVYNAQDTSYVTVTVHDPGAVAIGGNLQVCDGESTTLTASGNGQFLWNTGDTTAGITLSPTSSGTYSVTVTDGPCADSAQAALTVNPLPAASITGPTDVCPGDPVTLTASGGSSYAWSHGPAGPVLNFSLVTTANYIVTVTNAFNCSDTAHHLVTVAPAPNVQLGGDTLVCRELLLDAGHPGHSWLWNTGATGQTLLADTEGWYHVQVSNGTCSGSDSIHIQVSDSVFIDLGMDTTVCNANSIYLQPSSNATKFHWSTGSNLPSTIVNQSGTVSVIVANVCGMRIDEIEVNFASAPTLALDSAYALCGRVPLVLDIGQPNASSTWQHSADGFGYGTVSTAPTFTVTDGGYYRAIASNACGADTAAFYVTISPDSGLFVPNVFSPNGDGVNDDFRVEVLNPAQFALQIFDRWGRQVFETRNPNAPWRGHWQGKAAPDGLYFYVLKARGCGAQLLTLRGSVTLLR